MIDQFWTSPAYAKSNGWWEDNYKYYIRNYQWDELIIKTAHLNFLIDPPLLSSGFSSLKLRLNRINSFSWWSEHAWGKLKDNVPLFYRIHKPIEEGLVTYPHISGVWEELSLDITRLYSTDSYIERHHLLPQGLRETLHKELSTTIHC